MMSNRAQKCSERFKTKMGDPRLLQASFKQSTDPQSSSLHELFRMWEPTSLRENLFIAMNSVESLCTLSGHHACRTRLAATTAIFFGLLAFLEATRSTPAQTTRTHIEVGNSDLNSNNPAEEEPTIPRSQTLNARLFLARKNVLYAISQLTALLLCYVTEHHSHRMSTVMSTCLENDMNRRIYLAFATSMLAKCVFCHAQSESPKPVTHR